MISPDELSERVDIIPNWGAVIYPNQHRKRFKKKTKPETEKREYDRLGRRIK